MELSNIKKIFINNSLDNYSADSQIRHHLYDNNINIKRRDQDKIYKMRLTSSTEIKCATITNMIK